MKILSQVFSFHLCVKFLCGVFVSRCIPVSVTVCVTSTPASTLKRRFYPSSKIICDLPQQHQQQQQQQEATTTTRKYSSDQTAKNEISSNQYKSWGKSANYDKIFVQQWTSVMQRHGWAVFSILNKIATIVIVKKHRLMEGVVNIINSNIN